MTVEHDASKTVLNNSFSSPESTPPPFHEQKTTHFQLNVSVHSVDLMPANSIPPSFLGQEDKKSIGVAIFHGYNFFPYADALLAWSGESGREGGPMVEICIGRGFLAGTALRSTGHVEPK